MKLKILSNSLVLLLIASHAIAADSKKEARVTQIIRDVKLVPAEASARPAVVNDRVAEDTGVRTGGDSRSEPFPSQQLRPEDAWRGSQASLAAAHARSRLA